MSRTIRTTPHWALRWKEQAYTEGETFRGKTNDAVRWFHGYDGIHTTLCSPSNRSPRGFDTWDDRYGPGKDRRWAKRGAAKVIRRRGKKEILGFLNEAEDF